MNKYRMAWLFQIFGNVWFRYIYFTVIFILLSLPIGIRISYSSSIVDRLSDPSLFLAVAILVFLTLFPIVLARFFSAILVSFSKNVPLRVIIACALVWLLQGSLSSFGLRVLDGGYIYELYSVHVLISLSIFASHRLRNFSYDSIKDPINRAFQSNEDQLQANERQDFLRGFLALQLSETSTPDADRIAKIAQIQEFHDRADDLLSRSNVVFIIIVFVLIFSGLFVVFANAISQLGVARPDIVSAMTQDRDLLARQLLDIERRLQPLSEPSLGAFNTPSGGETKQQLPQSEIDFLRSYAERVRSEYNAVSAKLIDFREKILLDQLSENSSTNAFRVDPNVLLAQGITRFRVVIIAIYLVRILMTLYKFNTRMAAFYRSCRCTDVVPRGSIISWQATKATFASY